MDRDIEMRARAEAVLRKHGDGLPWQRGRGRDTWTAAIDAMISFAATSAATADGVGFVYWNPDAGEEYASSHPIDSGECVEAENIRRSTGQEDALHAAFQEQWQKAAALSASPLPGREEIARDLLAEFICCDDDDTGLQDCHDNYGEAYQSARLDGLLKRTRAFLLSLFTPPTEG